MTTPFTYEVITKHDPNGEERRRTFTDADMDVAFAAAKAYAESIGPMADGSTLPNAAEDYADHPRYSSSVCCGRNRFAAIIRADGPGWWLDPC
jgi:hypothetical protein